MATLKHEGILRHGSLSPVGSAVASYLHLSAAQIRAGLFAGQSLFDLAIAQHRNPAQLVNTIVGVHKTKLDTSVATGKLTAGQEAAYLSTLTKKITAAVDGMVK